jgi:hypothetical protein
MSIKSWIRNWLLDADNLSSKLSMAPPIGRSRDDIETEAAQLTFSIIKAMNGRIIKASVYKPASRGPDWQHELYIVKDEEKIPDVIARIMAIKALEQ